MIINKAKIAIKFISFVLLTCICVGMVNEWLKPKAYYTQTWPTTNTYIDFYNLERQSVDVLLLGSSHAVSCLNPQVIYDNYGITSYNLGSEQQSLVISYYWLREALKYQSPKVVVLDTYILHKYTTYAYVYNDMNCSESSVRKAMDSMRFSPLKWEAGKTIEAIDPTQSGLSFLLLNIRYHTRWSSLGEDDYTEKSMVEHGGIKGFTVLGGENPALTYTPFRVSDIDNVDAEPMVETSEKYLDKIVDLCAEKNIQLVLVNIPCNEPIARYKSTKEYAGNRGIPYYDFNEETLYNEINYNAAENLLSHPNYLGAEKVSLYLGNLLKNEYGVPSREDNSYDVSRNLYEHKIENIQLTQTTDAYQYLEMLNKDRYSLFIFAPTQYSASLNDEIMNRIFDLGFTSDLRGVSDGTHYCAVKDSDGIMEKLSVEDMNFSASIRDGLAIYSFTIDTSVILPAHHTYSMKIQGVECGNQNAGLNIVVYDNELKSIVEKVNINTNVPELTMKRY